LIEVVGVELNRNKGISQQQPFCCCSGNSPRFHYGPEQEKGKESAQSSGEDISQRAEWDISTWKDIHFT